MRLLVPSMYQKSIYDIDYLALKRRNVKCLLFDLDNTCVGYHEKKPTKELKMLFEKLDKLGFRVVIFSNASKKRLLPFQSLNVVCNPSSKKPFRYSFSKILKEYHYQRSEVCIIGDQLFTDIYGGNKVGIITCLVPPITNEDFFLTKIFRAMERGCFRNLEKKGILKKGEYYE